jgi:D-glycero-alpha-D-manno-heptose 1-phosphate guanylyltransferase
MSEPVRDLSDLTAAILAGGLGTRLHSVVSGRPKVLADVGKRPFLAYLLDQLAAIKMKKVVLCVGYLGQQVRAAFGDTYGPLSLVYSQENLPLGTAGALRLALPLLDSNPVLVMNGDSYLVTDLKVFWNWHKAMGAKGTLFLTKQASTQRYGRVQLDSAGFVVSFQEKGEQEGPGWINGGIYLIQEDLLETIPERVTVSLEKEIFPSWIHQGLLGYCSESLFLDIGTPEGYAAGELFFQEQILHRSTRELKQEE